MKLVRFGSAGTESPGVWLDPAGPGEKARILDVRAMAFDIEDYNSRFFAGGGIERLKRLLMEPGMKTLPADGARLGPPVARPGQIICMGKNYAAHVAEFDMAMPAAPILFGKSPGAAIGPRDAIVLPPDAGPVDWEVELAVVIGSRARRVPENEAMECVAGYMALNDVTDRRAQSGDGQWFRAKSADTFCPMGPFLVTRDEAGAPDGMALKSWLNGELFQDGCASQMIFKIPAIIAYASRSITLEPGDVIATGTPAGIATKRSPPVCLKPGDVVEIEVKGIGCQRCAVEGESRD